MRRTFSSVSEASDLVSAGSSGGLVGGVLERQRGNFALNRLAGSQRFDQRVFVGVGFLGEVFLDFSALLGIGIPGSRFAGMPAR